LLTGDAYVLEKSLDDTLKRFLDLESIGVNQDTPDVYAQFERQVSWKGSRYL